MNELLRQWGFNVKAGREALQMTQYDLAEAVGVRTASVSRWESGKVGPKDAHKLAIATALHQDVRQLFPLVRVAA